MVNHIRIEAWIEEFLWSKHNTGIKFVTTAEIYDAQNLRHTKHGLTMSQLTNVLSKRIRFGRGPMVKTAHLLDYYQECATWFSLTWRPSE